MRIRIALPAGRNSTSGRKVDLLNIDGWIRNQWTSAAARAVVAQRWMNRSGLQDPANGLLSNDSGMQRVGDAMGLLSAAGQRPRSTVAVTLRHFGFVGCSKMVQVVRET